MKHLRIVVALSVLMLIGIGPGSELFACGDKFLVVSRGTRFQRAAAARQSASILVYANPASDLPKALANVAVEATLRKAGYRPTSVTTGAEFDDALRQGGWDLVLVAMPDGQFVVSRLQGRAEPNAPLVLPVLYNPTTGELAQAKKLYPRIIKSPTKSQLFLDAIDDALASRTRPKPAGKSGN
jgi:hypothetical protein